MSGRSDLHQSPPTSGTLDPDVKDVIINFQAYCCVLQDCFPVHPSSRKPIPRKRPATYKYIGLLFVNRLQYLLTASFSHVTLAEILMLSSCTVPVGPKALPHSLLHLSLTTTPMTKWKKSHKNYVWKLLGLSYLQNVRSGLLDQLPCYIGEKAEALKWIT